MKKISVLLMMALILLSALSGTKESVNDRKAAKCCIPYLFVCELSGLGVK